MSRTVSNAIARISASSSRRSTPIASSSWRRDPPRSSILVVGVDLAASLASFLAYGLMPLGLTAEAPVGSAGNLQHKIDVLTDKDLVIAISFGRCLRGTMQAVLRARARGVATFGITDGRTTPIAMHCDAHLLAPIGTPSFTGSYWRPWP